MRLFYPLRPLTQSGRVMVGVAVSVFATLALVAWSPAHSAAPLVTCAGAAH